MGQNKYNNLMLTIKWKMILINNLKESMNKNNKSQIIVEHRTMKQLLLLNKKERKKENIKNN